MKRVPWTSGDLRLLSEMLRAGHTCQECADSLGRTLFGVYQYIRRHGMAREAHDGKWVRQRVAALYAKGWQDRRIAAAIGRSRSWVTHVRRVIGLPRLRTAAEDCGRNIRRTIERIGYHPCADYYARISQSLEDQGWPPGVTVRRAAALEAFVAAGEGGLLRRDLPGAPSTINHMLGDLRRCGWVERVGFDADGFARYRVVAWVAARRAEALKRKAVA